MIIYFKTRNIPLSDGIKVSNKKCLDVWKLK